MKTEDKSKNKPDDLKVFIASRETKCQECGEELDRHAWIVLAGGSGMYPQCPAGREQALRNKPAENIAVGWGGALPQRILPKMRFVLPSWHTSVMQKLAMMPCSSLERIEPKPVRVFVRISRES